MSKAQSAKRVAGWRVLPAALVLALIATDPIPVAVGAGATLPPQEAFEDYPGYEKWQVMETQVSKDGETVRIRLRHPDNPRVTAVLFYRLVTSTMREAGPDGPGGVAAPRP